MNKIVLTEEIIQSLNFLIEGAMKFYGYPNMSKHHEKVISSIQQDKVSEDAQERS